MKLVPFREIDVGPASKPEKVQLAWLPNSITRAVIIKNTDCRQLFDYLIFALKVKLPRLLSLSEYSGGTIKRQFDNGFF